MQEKSYERNARLEGEIRSVLSELLRLEVNDPRLADVTISGVKLSPDRSKAQVFFSVIGDNERERQAGDGCAAAASFMRRRLGATMRLRVVPALEFHRDASYEYGDRMDRLFDRLADQGLLPGEDPTLAGTEEDQ